ncbi:hypothetical protein NP603_12375 [Methylomonas sp. SURF-1]|uniref:PIN domain-containing protein n=1 Tax=Methylomonas aurea TaxID=2952224 RepID=A0ABT1UI36_9GAMM|nr:hypothetical protein [Methylomonas sp. SURF-1]MCQ8181906.1 hypothetical protein [Methylomonas sp. SURF-1]
MRKVLILDTSILCVWLDVPGMADCGPDCDKWDKNRVAEKIKLEEQDKTIFVLPLATIIETGNHIAQAQHSRRDRAVALADLIKKSANEETPWAAFSQQSELWAPEKLIGLAENWPDLASQKMSLGDATIKDVAEFYATMSFRVEILTGDTGLKAYQPTEPIERPRRKRRE